MTTVPLGYAVASVIVVAIIAYGLGLICGMQIHVYHDRDLDNQQEPR